MGNVQDLLEELQKNEEDSEFDLALVAIYMRYAYGFGYLDSLKEPDPNPKVARDKQLEAWARLP